LAKIDIAKNYTEAKVGEIIKRNLKVCYNIELLLLEKFNKFFWRECKQKISLPKLKPRYLCDYTAESIESTFK
jgi:hypothetical protein